MLWLLFPLQTQGNPACAWGQSESNSEWGVAYTCAYSAHGFNRLVCPAIELRPPGYAILWVSMRSSSSARKSAMRNSLKLEEKENHLFFYLNVKMHRCWLRLLVAHRLDNTQLSQSHVIKCTLSDAQLSPNNLMSRAMTLISAWSGKLARLKCGRHDHSQAHEVGGLDQIGCKRTKISWASHHLRD